MTEYKLVKAKNSDLTAITELHMTELSEDLLPAFGEVFLSEYFYPALLESSECRVYTVYEKTELVGFFVIDTTGLGISKIISGLKRACIMTCLKNNWKMIRVIPEIITMLFYGRKVDSLPEIAFIITARNHQRKGIGRIMINQIIQIIDSSCLVKTSKGSAREFYEKLGFVYIGQEYRGFRVLDVMKYKERKRC